MIELTDKIRKRFEIQLKKIYVGNAELKKRRPKLDQIHYSKDGHVEITNSHVGVRLSDVHDKGDSDEEFPMMDNIFRLPDEVTSIEFDMETLRQLENQTNVLFRYKLDVVKMTMTKEGITLTSKPLNDMNFVECGLKMELPIDNEVSIGLNPRYLHDALNMFRMIGVENATLYYESELRPIHLVYENLHYLITPIRTS